MPTFKVMLKIRNHVLASVPDEVVQDQPGDYDKPPPIFISYQYDQHEKVMLLKRHLCDAGFKTWLSQNQMGGGDKVKEQTEQGIRAAQVIICCVSSKYANSNNSTFTSEVR